MKNILQYQTSTPLTYWWTWFSR